MTSTCTDIAMKDKNIVPYNPEIAILWDAAHNIQVYLDKYISKPELSFFF